MEVLMREKINFDRDWMFHKGDIESVFPTNGKEAAYFSAKTERMLWGPASQNYDTGMFNSEKWKRVNLPHDYVIEEIPSEEYSCAFGFFPHHNAWYIKKFRLEESDKNRRITLLFEGVATHATVYVNGCLLKHNFCGYTSFEVDMTDVVKYNAENTVSVYVNTQHHEGWWYDGGGIYRHVWLNKTDLLSVDLWGVFAKPVKEADGTWTVHTETTLRNDDVKPRRATVCGEIIDGENNTVATAEITGSIIQKDTRVFRYKFRVENPALWSPDTPVQYCNI
jgi:beta-galactosidase